MSLSLLLIPAAIAYVGVKHALATPEEREGHFIHVSTRMKDVGILRQALEDTGGQIRKSKYVTKDDIYVDWGDEQATFSRDENGIWAVHFTLAKNFERANQIISDLDDAYGLRVQERVIERLVERSSKTGLNVESIDRNDDNDVTIVLAVQREIQYGT